MKIASEIKRYENLTDYVRDQSSKATMWNKEIYNNNITFLDKAIDSLSSRVDSQQKVIEFNNEVDKLSERVE